MFKILKQFLQKESLMVQSYEETEKTLKTCQEMFEETVRTLRYSDTAAIRIDIREKDQQINKYQQEIRRKMLSHLAIAETKELSTALVLISIVIDVERIGDYTKNIEDLAIRHPKRLKVGKYEEIIEQLEKEVKSKFETVIASFTEYDIESAREVMSEHRSINKQCDQILNELVLDPTCEIPSNALVVLALFVRYLKRISSHLTNIVSSVANPFDMIGFKDSNRKKDD